MYILRTSLKVIVTLNLAHLSVSSINPFLHRNPLFPKNFAIKHNTANKLASDVIELLNEIHSNHAQPSNNTQSISLLILKFIWCVLHHFIPVYRKSLDLYDKAEKSTYAYLSSDDDLFFEATTILDEHDDIE